MAMLSEKAKIEINKSLNVINDVIRDLTLLQYIPRYRSHLPPRLNDYLSSDGKQDFHDLFETERRFKRTLNKDLETRLLGNTRRVISHLGRIKDPEKILYGFPKSPQISKYLSLLEEFRILYEGKLNLSFEERILKDRQKKQSEEREKKDKADIRAFTSALSYAKQNREADQIQKEIEKKKVNHKIDEVQKNIKTLRSNFRNDLSHKRKREVDKRTTDRVKLSTEIERTDNDTTKVVKHNLDGEKSMKRLRKQKENIVDNFIGEYKKEMKELEKEKEDFIRAVEADDEAIDKLEKSVKELKEEKEKIREERRIREEHLKENVSSLQSYVHTRLILKSILRAVNKKKGRRR